MTIKKYLQQTQKLGPLYVSFPSGEKPIFLHWGLDANGQLNSRIKADLDRTFVDYASILPVMYLREITRGKMILSLKNVATATPLPHPGELSDARFFLDLKKGLLLDLRLLRQQNGQRAFDSILVPGQIFQKKIHWDAQHKQIIFFVLGAAKIELTGMAKKIPLQQTYGQSYQLFAVQDFASGDQPQEISLTIQPLLHTQPVRLVGPFVQ